MTTRLQFFFRQYGGMLRLLAGILVGSICGAIFGSRVEVLKPLGDIFLNLLFTAVIPLVFFAVSSAIASLPPSSRVSKVMAVMALVFLSTILISAFFTIVATWIYPIHQVLPLDKMTEVPVNAVPFGEQVTNLVTTSEFYLLLSRKSMLSLIIFSVLMGFAALRSGQAGASFRGFLLSGNEVMKQLIVVIMQAGPIGLGAYFAYQVGVFGPQLFGTYARSMALYYGFGTIYFLVFFSIYAFVGGGIRGIGTYWRNNIVPSLTAVGTCSSIATVPANLEAAKNMGVPATIRNIVVPLGATLHKDGSSISSIVKMAVVFGMFGRDFTGVDTILLALGITVLVSMVEGGIPNGGYIGELLLISAYGLPPEALPPAMIIGTLVDPLATLLNATGDTVAAMVVTRFTRNSNGESL